MKLTILAALLILLIAACHPIVKPPAIDIKPHVAPRIDAPALWTVTPTPAKERN